MIINQIDMLNHIQIEKSYEFCWINENQSSFVKRKNNFICVAT